jgi:hypothetical protein
LFRRNRGRPEAEVGKIRASSLSEIEAPSAKERRGKKTDMAWRTGPLWVAALLALAPCTPTAKLQHAVPAPVYIDIHMRVLGASAEAARALSKLAALQYSPCMPLFAVACRLRLHAGNFNNTAFVADICSNDSNVSNYVHALTPPVCLPAPACTCTRLACTCVRNTLI